MFLSKVEAPRSERAFKTVLQTDRSCIHFLEERHVWNRQVKDSKNQSEAITFQLWLYDGTRTCIPQMW